MPDFRPSIFQANLLAIESLREPADRSHDRQEAIFLSKERGPKERGPKERGRVPDGSFS